VYSSAVDSKVRPYFHKRTQLTIRNGCLLWGLRVMIPERHHHKVMKLPHSGHPGMTQMKSLARLHIWWPDIDSAIEGHTKSRTRCATAGRDPTCVPLHQWELPLRPWQRVHIDYAGPFKGKMWLLLIDSFSKWPEVVEMTDTGATATISKLKHILAYRSKSFQTTVRSLLPSSSKITAVHVSSYTKPLSLIILDRMAK